MYSDMSLFTTLSMVYAMISISIWCMDRYVRFVRDIFDSRLVALYVGFKNVPHRYLASLGPSSSFQNHNYLDYRSTKKNNVSSLILVMIGWEWTKTNHFLTYVCPQITELYITILNISDELGNVIREILYNTYIETQQSFIQPKYLQNKKNYTT